MTTCDAVWGVFEGVGEKWDKYPEFRTVPNSRTLDLLANFRDSLSLAAKSRIAILLGLNDGQSAPNR